MELDKCDVGGRRRSIAPSALALSRQIRMHFSAMSADSVLIGKSRATTLPGRDPAMQLGVWLSHESHCPGFEADLLPVRTCCAYPAIARHVDAEYHRRVDSTPRSAPAA
jgi:hypothetical protein